MSSEQNLDEFKEMYYERLYKYFSDTHENVDSDTWGSRLWIQNMINRLKQAKINTSKGETEKTLSDLPNTLLVKFKDGKEILANKIKMGCVELQVKVIPWQDSFDVIRKAHIASNHGNMESTKHNLSRKKVCVNSNCIRVFIDLCDKFTFCNQQKLSKKQKKSIYNVAGIFQVIDMTSLPDGDFSHILVYEDMETKLTQLRGLTQSFDIEIAMELFKIFMDLGPPKTLIALKEGCYTNVIEIINNLCYPCSITFSNGRDDMLDKSFQIKSLVNSWMRDSNSTHWEVGCHVVQWQINNIKLGHISPYQIVFGSIPDIEKSTTQINYTSSKLKIESLQIEEDLGFFRDEDIKSEIEDSISISDRSSEPEVMEDNLVGISEDLDGQNIKTENLYVGLTKSVDAISKNNESAPLDATKESENARPLDKRSLDTLGSMLDLKEELVEAPLNVVIDAQCNSNVKNEGNLMDCVSDEMQNLNENSSLSYKGAEHTFEVNESNMEDAFKLEDAVANSDTESACVPTLMDVEEEFEKRRENAKIDNGQSICNECNMTISTKAYTCTACLKNVHLFCSERITGVISTISQVVCLSCVSVQQQSRLEELKTKSKHELNKMWRN